MRGKQTTLHAQRLSRINTRTHLREALEGLTTAYQSCAVESPSIFHVVLSLSKSVEGCYCLGLSERWCSSLTNRMLACNCTYTYLQGPKYWTCALVSTLTKGRHDLQVYLHVNVPIPTVQSVCSCMHGPPCERTHPKTNPVFGALIVSDLGTH